MKSVRREGEREKKKLSENIVSADEFVGLLIGSSYCAASVANEAQIARPLRVTVIPRFTYFLIKNFSRLYNEYLIASSIVI